MYRHRARPPAQPYTLRSMRRSDPATVFSELAPFWRDASARSERIARRVVSHLRPGGHVLDVGCGTGSVLAHIRAESHRRGKRIGRTVGVDLAEGMAERAARRAAAVRPVVGDARTLPFIDQYFDVVVATDVMQFLADPARAVRELFRVTMPGGTIVIELAPGRVQGLRRRELLDLPRWSLLRRYVEMRRTYAIAEIRNVLTQMGCVVREVASRSRRDHTQGLLLSRLVRGGEVSVATSPRVIVARLPGPRRGRMPIRVENLSRWTPARVASVLEGLPQAPGYEVLVKPLRWRTRPHVQVLRVRSKTDHHSGPAAVHSVQRRRSISREAHPQGTALALPLVLAAAALRTAGRADPVPVPARVLPLVSARDPQPAQRSRDGVRPVRAAAARPRTRRLREQRPRPQGLQLRKAAHRHPDAYRS